ncbi:MAG TPA: hypothetical protein VF160_16885 [Candidatus Dormibacteraeota bacterium]
MSYRRFGPGEEATEFEPGDFILTHRDGPIPRLIRAGQRLRYRGADRPYAHWSHAALIADKDGAIVEAEASGVRRDNLSRYKETEYHVVHLGQTASERDRRQAVAFAERLVGQAFGFGEMLAISLSLLSSRRLSFTRKSHLICSVLVARALERTDAVFELDPGAMLPADLAKHYGVKP